jgi:hypothetical protein
VFVSLHLADGYLGACSAEMFTPDIGEMADAAWRILAGQVPHQDFHAPYGPLVYAWYGAWFHVLGANWFAIQMSHVASVAACLVLAAGVVPFAFRSRWTGHLWLVTVWFMSFAWYGLRVWVPLAGFCVVLGARRRGDVMAGCAVCGVGILVSPETGLAACLGAFVLTVLRCADRRHRLASLAALGAPVAFAVLIAPRMVLGYFRNSAGLAGVATYYSGLPFPAPGQGEAWFYWAPYFFSGLALAWFGFRILRTAAGAMRNEAAGNFALALVAAAYLRSGLGRSDLGHVFFGCAPVLMLGFRLLERAPNALAWTAGPLLLAPFLYHEIPMWSGFVEDISRPRDVDHVPIPGQAVRSSPGEADRHALVEAGIARLAPPGAPILFLPHSFRALLHGRRPAIPFLLPLYVVMAPDFPALAIKEMEDQQVPLVVMEGEFCVPGGGGYLPTSHPGPFSGNLNSETPADEVIFREFGEYLRTRYELRYRVGTVEFYTRRATPVRPPREIVVRRMAVAAEDEASLARGRAVTLAFPPVDCNEVRIALECGYWPGLAGFAKTRLRLSYEGRDGGTVTGVLPVPPARLGRDLRFTVPGGRIRSLTLCLSRWGALEPFPVRVRLSGISFVRVSPVR